MDEPLSALASLSRRRCARETSARHQTKVYVGMLPPSLTSAELLDLIIDDFEWAEESVRVLFFRSGSEGTYNRKEVHGVAYLAVMGNATELIELLAEHSFAVDGPPARDYRPRCFVAAFNRVARRVQGSERSMVSTIDAQAVYQKWMAEHAPPPQSEAPPAAADAEEGAAADAGDEGAAGAAEASGGAVTAVAGAVANLAPFSSSSFGFGAEERIIALAKEADARNAARAAQVAPLVAHLIRISQQKERVKKAAQKKKGGKGAKKGAKTKGAAAHLDAAAKRKLRSARGVHGTAYGAKKKKADKKALIES